VEERKALVGAYAHNCWANEGALEVRLVTRPERFRCSGYFIVQRTLQKAFSRDTNHCCTLTRYPRKIRMNWKNRLRQCGDHDTETAASSLATGRHRDHEIIQFIEYARWQQTYLRCNTVKELSFRFLDGEQLLNFIHCLRVNIRTKRALLYENKFQESFREPKALHRGRVCERHVYSWLGFSVRKGSIAIPQFPL